MLAFFYLIMFYIYILYSENADKYYIGQTDNVERRLLEHNEFSENSFTSKYRPWVLMAKFAVGNSRGVALKIEKHIKKQKSRKYIEQIIERKSIQKLIEKYSSVG